ncbi:MAG: DUF1015 domain-containing protein [Candidatus Methylomirabilales bacterium]
MAIVLPFRGIHYDPARVGEMVKVVSPPYDVIGEGERADYHRRSPYNVVRLILGEDRPGDGETENRYLRARRYFHTWVREGILVRDEHPAFYLYQQDYAWQRGTQRRRTGLIGMVRLEEYASRVIFPHERTFAGPKADRLRLMQTLPVDLEQLFAFYPDEGAVQRLLIPPATPALFDFADERGIRHRLWHLDESDRLRALTTALTDRPLFIADGHHRYETALAYRSEVRSSRPRPGRGAPASDYVMMTLVGTSDEGLTILPTHRLLPPGRLSMRELLDKLVPHFTVEDRPLDPTRDVVKLLGEVEDRGRQGHVFGLYAGGDVCYLLTLKDPTTVRGLLGPDHSEAFCRLDVVILHRLVLEHLIGIVDERSVAFTQDPGHAVARVQAGEAAAAIFLNPTPVENVMAVAQAGERMPPKSTFFYPKILSGLVFASIGPTEILEGSPLPDNDC